MYNEFNTVQESVNNIKNVYPDSNIFVVQSNDETGRIISKMDSFIILENLAKKIKPYKLAAHAISRNYSALFNIMYDTKTEYDVIVALTGDTLVADPGHFLQIYNIMTINNKNLSCSQAIGQNFHAADSDPENGRCGGRIQYSGISDFMPQFFMVDGKFSRQTKVFSDIQVTNPHSSEQCLGDNFMKHINRGEFLDNAYIISPNAYEYSQGIVYQVKG